MPNLRSSRSDRRCRKPSAASAAPASEPASVAPKAKLFRGLADTTRLTILETLRDGPHTVGEVVARTGLSQSSVSMHLSCLWDCGLVLRQPRGRFVVYRLASPKVERVLRAAEALLSHAAEGFYRCTRYVDRHRAAAARRS